METNVTLRLVKAKTKTKKRQLQVSVQYFLHAITMMLNITDMKFHIFRLQVKSVPNICFEISMHFPCFCSEPLSLPADAIRINATTLTDSSVTVEWKPILNVPPDLSDNYEYVLESVASAANASAELTHIDHSELMTNVLQEVTLYGLLHNTEYTILVKSYRVVRNAREETDVQSVTFSYTLHR